MIFVPDAAPHFVLVCLENFGWSVRDYSSGEIRLIPAIALGQPIDRLVEGPRAKGCLAFEAPRVPVSDLHFWKRLTEELGKRFLGVRATIQDTLGHGYPVLAESAFNKATSHLTPIEVESLLRSPRSSDWTTWNAIQLLLVEHPRDWWSEIIREAIRVNPANEFPGEAAPEIGFWKVVQPCEAYDPWRRTQMRQGPQNGREHIRALDVEPLEPAARVDLRFDNKDWVIFAESRINHDLNHRAQNDPRRNRIIQLADCLLTTAKGRPCALWILARDRSPDREYVQLVERYRSSPEMFAAELPYHPAEVLYRLAQRLTVLQWADLVGGVAARNASDDAATTRVRKELRRRIKGAALAVGA
jgi:hypothetical protein